MTENKNHILGDAPIEQKYTEEMNILARFLDKKFNDEMEHEERKIGFVLLVFPFGDEEGRCNFISNGADRKDIVCLFKEMIKRFEGQPEVKGNA